MEINEYEGDIFTAVHILGYSAIAHGVNCLGVMGAGIAKPFKEKFPEMYDFYRCHCVNNWLQPGGCLPYLTRGGVYIYNLASQENPGADAKLEWILGSFAQMVCHASHHRIDRIATVRIGCGIGGLTWDEVKPALENNIQTDIVLSVFRPEGT